MSQQQNAQVCQSQLNSVIEMASVGEKKCLIDGCLFFGIIELQIQYTQRIFPKKGLTRGPL